MNKNWISLLVVISVFCMATCVPTNYGPVIGIMTEPYNDNPKYSEYMAASYVKYIESAGGIVIPIRYTDSIDDLTKMFGKLNGLLFPGGGVDISDPKNPYIIATTHLYNLARQSNDNGNHFPIWGTCLGFQTLSIISSGNYSILSSGYDSENLPLPLDFVGGGTSSRLFSGASPDLIKVFSSENVTMNAHQAGVSPQAFVENLASMYTLISTNVDRKGREFISTMEHKKYPFYGSQWHPEKNSFEFNPNYNIPHSANAILVCQYSANFLVNEARKSPVTISETDLLNYVIWNENPVFTLKSGGYFEQSYYW